MVWAGLMVDWSLLRPTTNYLKTKGLCCILVKNKLVVDAAGTSNTVVAGRRILFESALDILQAEPSVIDR